ncbi:MAG: hypothetical protein N2049_10930 [Anaerolineales bacterium]|nr:hypothetical protein [Anaerolineales bacterium]
MSVESVLLSHFARYPAMGLADLYKLIHQAALGSEHAIRDPEAARRWLNEELASLGEGPDEPLLDLLSEETGILRVHLRPYLASGGDPEHLLRAFLRTANEFRGHADTLERYWQTAIRLERFPPDEMEKFIRPLRAKNYPAVHHSPLYERLYRPAYRVIWQGFW